MGIFIRVAAAIELQTSSFLATFSNYSRGVPRRQGLRGITPYGMFGLPTPHQKDVQEAS